MLKKTKKVVVVSHQRSGTHFLMKTLANHFELTDNPVWLMDFNLGIDIWSPPALLHYLRKFEGKSNKHIMKCHFFADFFLDFVEYFTEEYTVFYVVRKPEDVLASYYTFSNKLKWGVSAKANSLSEYIRSEPAGSCLRFQKKQYETMLQRWIAHVEGWYVLSQKYNIHIVRYDDLNLKFNDTVERIATILQQPITRIEKPDLTGLLPWTSGMHRDLYSLKDMAYIEKHAGNTINKIWPF
ncbi:MAG: sulfotransferase domain-containing protein [Pseudomonadota bacterium]